MNTSKLIVTAAAAITVFGALTSAYAQGTSTQTDQRQGTMPQTQGQMQQQTTPSNQGSTGRSATDGSMNRTDGSGTNAMGNRTDSMSTDGRSVTRERAARADRN